MSESNNRVKKVIFPRGLAVKILVRVLSENEPLDESLAAVSGEVSKGVFPWLQEICAGTLRWKGRLDWILDSISLKKKPSGWLRKVMLLAVYQLVVQDRTPAAAVVSETVSEIKSKEGEPPAKFANACLRKVADHALQWRNQPFPRGNQKEQAAWASLPEWVWSKIVEQQGLEWAKAYALASLERPVLWVRTRKENPETLPAHSIKGPVDCSWQISEGGVVTELSGFREGEFIVQDISSQFLVAEVAAEVKKRITRKIPTGLDLCSAPGGKALGLTWSGFKMIATDYNASRLTLLRETIARVSSPVDIVPWETWEAYADQDLIWVDAPCSGTGILRRHPDVRWLRREKELSNLTQTQRDLLLKAWKHLPAGGFLVYSVCSVLKEEGPDAIESQGLNSFIIKKWSLCPQDAPHGDGFWAVLLGKPAPESLAL